MSNETEVLIVGAGPTGLTAAIELARRGINVRIVEKSPAPASESRALAVQARSLEFFEKMGVVQAVLEAGSPGVGAGVISQGKALPLVDLTELSDNSPYPFAHIIPQNETERILIERLSQLGVTVERETELESFEQSADSVKARLRKAGGTTEVSASYLVGCDGAHSTVRHGLNMPFEGDHYDQTFLLADLEMEWPFPNDRIWIAIGNESTVGVFNFREEKHKRVIVISYDRLTAGEEPTLQDIERAVEQAVGRHIPVANPVWLTRFRLHHRGVPRYSQGRVFLAGDAAHIHSPAGGQGMNTGIQDAFNLGWKLALVLRGNAHETLLASYHDERYPVGRKLLNGTDRLFRLAASRNPVFRRVRSTMAPFMLRRALKIGLLRRKLRRFVSQLGIRYRRSPIVQGWLRDGIRPGDRIPDLELRSNEGATRLFKELDPVGHTIVAFESDPEKVRAVLPKKWSATPILDISGQGQASAGFVDLKRYLTDHCGVQENEILLVRPDGHLAFRGDGRKPEQLAQFITNVYGS